MSVVRDVECRVGVCGVKIERRQRVGDWDEVRRASWGRGWERGGRCVVGGHLIAGDGQMERASPQGGTTLGIVSPRVRVVQVWGPSCEQEHAR